MASGIPSDPQNAQNRPAWGWNSINSFVENTKTASESFFDNVTATLAKKQDGSAIALASTNTLATDINAIESKPQDWKSKYIQLKHAHTLKTGMLNNELQKYKDHNVSFKRHISLQTESKIAKLEAQITKYQQNEAKCIQTMNENMRQYYQNIDYLQHQIDHKYKIFDEKLLNVTVKAGLNPTHIFQTNDTGDKSIQNLIDITETEYQNTSDFEEKEQIHNAEECIETTHMHKPEKEHHMHGMDEKEHTIQIAELQTKYDTQIMELQCKLRESDASLGQYRIKFFDLVQTNEDLKQNNTTLTQKISTLNADIETQKEEYDELEALFSSMSDQNTDFQQQIKDVEGENVLLRQQLHEYKLQKQKEIDVLMMENEERKESLDGLEIKNAEISNKLENEYEISQQLREQIKSISKTLHKKTKSNVKYKRKMEALDKKIESMEYTAQEQQRKLTKYMEQIAELESEQSKYNNAISQYKTLQQEIESYINENYGLRNELNDVQNELTIVQEHGNELRKQCKRDTQNISRLTKCNDELIDMMKQCEDVLVDNAHQYLPVSLINAHELECTDSENDEDYKHTLVSDDKSDTETHKNVIYFNDSDSDLDDVIAAANNDKDEEDEIMKAARANDMAALQSGVRLKIQIAMLSEQLGKFQTDINHFKRELHRKEEQSMRQQHELRQIAIQKRLHAQVRKELGKRERDMISIASVRGMNMRHKTSLAKLTQTQDRVNRIVNRIQDNNQSFTNNIAMQLSGNTKARAMTVSDSPSSVRSVLNEKQKRNRSHYNPFYASENGGYEDDSDALKFETQSMHSYVSDLSKRSVQSQSAISLNMHYLNSKRKRSMTVQPMQTVQSQKSPKHSKKSPKKISFSNRWY